MPHARNRHIVTLLLKKLKFTPVVTIQGPRQSGKSFLAREILPNYLGGMSYVTFDDKSHRDFATRNPDIFLEQRDSHSPLAIDEAQKVPDIFDAVKLQVDQKRRPGRYLLLGSTEFSREVLVRESLTGRISKVRLYPLNMAETKGLPPNPSDSPFGLNESPRLPRKDFLRYLEQGGLPGIFGVRDASARDALLTDWIETTIYRDLQQFPKLKVDSELAYDILRLVATEPDPEAGRIAKVLRRDVRRVRQHLHLLSVLFAVTATRPFRLSTGKERYHLCDVAVARMLGASFERQIETHFLSERLSQHSNQHGSLPRLSFYRSQKGALTHFIEETREHISAVLIIPDQQVTKQSLARLEAFQEKVRASDDKRKVSLRALAPIDQPMVIHGVRVLPWESVA